MLGGLRGWLPFPGLPLLFCSYTGLRFVMKGTFICYRPLLAVKPKGRHVPGTLLFSRCFPGNRTLSICGKVVVKMKEPGCIVY